MVSGALPQTLHHHWLHALPGIVATCNDQPSTGHARTSRSVCSKTSHASDSTTASSPVSAAALGSRPACCAGASAPKRSANSACSGRAARRGCCSLSCAMALPLVLLGPPRTSEAQLWPACTASLVIWTVRWQDSRLLACLESATTSHVSSDDGSSGWGCTLEMYVVPSTCACAHAESLAAAPAAALSKPGGLQQPAARPPCFVTDGGIVRHAPEGESCPRASSDTRPLRIPQEATVQRSNAP